MASVSRVLPGLFLARLRHAGARWLLVATGIAVAGVLPVLAAAFAATTVDAALQRGIGTRPVGERSVTVSYNGITGDAELAAYDAAVRTDLPRLTGRPIHRQLIFREMSDTRGGSFVLGAADDLPHAVRLVGGRLPRSCRPARCEVVSLTGSGPDPYLDPGLGLVVVGHAVRSDPLLLSGTFDPGTGVALLLADGVGAAGRISSLDVRQRTVGWVAALDLGTIRTLGVQRWVAAGAEVADALWTAHPGLVVTTLATVVSQEDERARRSAQRFTVLGSATAVLLLGTAVVGGAALRDDHEAFLGALRRRGAPRRLLRLLLAGEALAPAAAGTALALATGAALAGALGAGAGLDPGGTARSAVLAALPVVLGLGAGAAAVLAGTLAIARARPGADAGIRHSVEALALGCAAVAVLLASRGGVGAAGQTDDPLLSALPVLVLLSGSLLLARGWRPLTRRGQGLLPRRALGARLGLAAAAGGEPLRPAATAALLTAAVAVCVFAGAYGATLDRGAADQASFAVPLDALVTTGQSLSRPLDVAGPDTLARLLPGASAYPVLRLAGSVRQSAGQGQDIRVIGLDPTALPHVARWGSVTGGEIPAADVAAHLAVAGTGWGSTGGSGIPLAPGRRLVVGTPGARVDLAVTAFVLAPDGRETGVPLNVSAPGQPPALSADLAAPIGTADGPETWRDPAGRPVPLRLVALTLRQGTDEATRTQHAIGERRTDVTLPHGAFRLGAVRVDGVGRADPWRGWSGPGMTPAAGGEVAVTYELTTGQVVLTGRPNGPGDTGLPLPVAVDPSTAASARDGFVTLTLTGQPVSARVVAVLDRFPTMPDGRFAVADVRALARLADLAEPGTGMPGELWIRLPQDRTGRAEAVRALSAEPFDRLAVDRSADRANLLRTDPVAVGARRLLAVGALLTLLVAACALVLLVVADRRDDAAQSYAWEADGVAPPTLRAALWWRGVAVTVPAVPAGVVVGLVLSRATARLVAVTATAQAPQPPLAPGTSAGWGLAVAAGGIAAGLLLAGAVALAAFREPLPVRRDAP